MSYATTLHYSSNAKLSKRVEGNTKLLIQGTLNSSKNGIRQKNVSTYLVSRTNDHQLYGGAGIEDPNGANAKAGFDLDGREWRRLDARQQDFVRALDAARKTGAIVVPGGADDLASPWCRGESVNGVVADAFPNGDDVSAGGQTNRLHFYRKRNLFGMFGSARKIWLSNFDWFKNFAEFAKVENEPEPNDQCEIKIVKF